jgi:type IV pilus assembly protein PilB
MLVAADQLKLLLVGSNLVSLQQFTDAEAEAKRLNISLDEYLVDSGLVTDMHVGQLIANTQRLNYINLTKQKIPDEVLNIVPEVVARSHGVISFAKTPTVLNVGMIDPGDIEIVHFLEKRTGLEVKTFFLTTTDFKKAILRYEASAEEAIKAVLEKLKEGLSKLEQQEAVVDLVNIIMRSSYTNGVSDIHIDPKETKAVIRFRIDGILNDIIEIPKEVDDTVVSRIKILGKMRTDEHRMAQDGKISFAMTEEGVLDNKPKEKRLDIRVSIVPTTHGENVVMRVLSSQNRSLTLDDVGFSEADAEKVRAAAKSTIGMILVTGPTGSGKTTTLYSVLKILNRRDVNIATIEDPVEYSIEGVTQIQVNVKTDLTFANGLRAIVRQDPNIIMVGEIRDHETADIAVNSAMTGHLVLSTLHANDAATTLPRLLDMGIEPFLVASTVNIVIGQRLVRKICENCRTSYILDEEEKEFVKSLPKVHDEIMKRTNAELTNIRLYKGQGCKMCENTGFVNRVGIFEILTMSRRIKEQILLHDSSDEIMKTAIEEGMTTMLQDGIEKVFNGTTTLKELLRVVNSG